MRLLALVFAAVAIPPLLGQEVAGSIAGRVLDPSGAGVPAAEVVAHHAETGALRRTITSVEGSYAFPDLAIGVYEITVSHPGFKKAVRKDITLHVSERMGLTITLELGDLAQEVTISESALQVQSESSDQGGIITGEQVRELQLNGRSFMTLLELIPGVSSNMPDRADPNSNPDVSINGARSSAASFNIDGGNNSDVIVGSSSLNTFASVETIAEFKVITSTFSAEYGRGGFSQINVVTKSGTRQFHGSLYEFFRNDALDARDYLSHQVLPLKLNNFGYTLGGPLILAGYNRDRKKTFFFFTQEFNRISMRGEAVNTRVPTAAEKQGDFREYGPGRDGVFGTTDDPVIDPQTGRGFPGGVMPAARFDANAVKLLALYPLPNFQGPGVLNYTSAAASTQNWRQELIRADHNFSQKFKVYGRYVQDNAYVRNPYGGSGTTGASTRFPGIAETQSDRPGKNLVADATAVVRPTLLNQFHFTFAQRVFAMRSVAPQADRTALGLTIPELFPENEDHTLPTISLGSSYTSLNVPRRGGKRLFNLELADNLTWIKGRHVIKTGGIYSYGGNLERQFSPNTNGSFTFSTNLARHPVANMLLGLPFSYNEVERTVFSDARFGMFEAYVQDDVRVNNRLVLNAGLRYSAYLNPYDLNDQLANFATARYDPAKAPAVNSSNGQLVPDTGYPYNGIVLAGKDSPYGRRVTNHNADLLGPRFGFAWAPFAGRKSSLRGGYGIYYTRTLIGTFINNTFDIPLFSRSVTVRSPTFNSPGAGAAAAVSPPDLTSLQAPLLAPVTHQWSFGIQHEVARNSLLNVSYVASRGYHWLRPFNINNPEAGQAAALGVHYNAARPYRGYGNIRERQSTGSGNYHSLQASFNRRIARKLTLTSAYTWGKSIDDGSSDRNTGDLPPNSRNPQAERGPSDYDRTHIFTGSFIYSLPQAGRRRNPALKTMFNGWQLSGILRFWTGRPLDVTMTEDVADIGAQQNQRPDVIAETSGPRTVEQWFNRYAFARPKDGTFGNMGRNGLRGPGVNKWDLSLFKNFRFEERYQLTFRAEFFNAFNHPILSTVATSLRTTAAGVFPDMDNFALVTGTRESRVLQFALKLTF